MPPKFDVNAIIKLAERTEYETWLLEAVFTLVEKELFPSWPDGVVYPLDKSEAQFLGYARANIIIGDWRVGFLNAGAPLVFISTFKLLDMLVEWILEENGFSSTFRFQKKLQKLKDSPIFPQAIESRAWLKERLAGFYSMLEPLRGTIIHDKHFTATDGAIRVANSRKDVLEAPVEISADHLRMLGRTIISVLRFVDGTWHLDEFREKMLRHELDELAVLHGLPLLGQRPPFHTCVRVFSTDSDLHLIDQMAILRDLNMRYVNHDCSFDLRVLIVRAGEVVDAYFFPWSVFADQDTGWIYSINAEKYRVAVPDEIKPEHLRHDVITTQWGKILTSD